MSVKPLYACLLALTLNACATTSSNVTPLTLDFGAKPTSNESAIEEYMSGSLKDAESARYRFDDAVKAYCQGGALSGDSALWSGWVVPFKVNARNSYGGYVGFKPYYARYDEQGLMDVSERYHTKWDFVPTLGLGCKLVVDE